ncbi:sensor histidine kinase [Kaistia terrae]|uniref:histidine kinase n=1 Tax=Kaistia terrae TaxID=537017 RepID=A0ABW0PZ00_9HYPH|nr:HAMP domain-containing sensor histidine kinase [Kaistia terrae]MCX5581685.1 HAMP domain-containing sensor histidine kinase [Kaistia terrae]
MWRAARLRMSSIRWQIGALSTIPIFILCVIVVVAESTSVGPRSLRSEPMLSASRIETVYDQVRHAQTPQEVGAILDTMTRMGLPARIVSSATIAPHPIEGVPGETGSNILRGLPTALGAVVSGPVAGSDNALNIVIPLDARESLVFSPEGGSGAGFYLTRAFTITTLFVLFSLPLLFVTLYAGRAIIAPLTDVSNALQTLSPKDGPERPFSERGAHEINNLARALNDMRSRVRRMIDDRTRMLRAISHDLRTPLTRLRLRIERSNQPELRDAMLKDIASISAMMEETLTYLADDVAVEPTVRADLPSLIETVCSDFTDIGFSVRYDGPARLTYCCKPLALGRAITNLVDNATKFAKAVEVHLSVHQGGARIEVRDNGPGVPPSLHGKIVEPFFKVNTARPNIDQGGFGLGLSIVRDIAHAHSGTLEFAGNSPHGLIVIMKLPAQDRAGNQQSPPPRIG